MSEIEVDLVADLNAQDDDGYGWSTLPCARHPESVNLGSKLLAGNSQAPSPSSAWLR
jgi:hypothetical protein